MGVEFYSGLKGDSNGYFMQKFGIDPANARLPFMLAQVPAPEKTAGDGGSLGKIQAKEEGITIFGKAIGAAGTTSTSAIVLSEEIIPEDIIIGTWFPSEGGNHSSYKDGPITFRKQGNIYVGQFTYLYMNYDDFPDGIRVTITYKLYSSSPGRSLTRESQRDYQTTYTTICTPYYRSSLCDKPGESPKGEIKIWYDPKKQRYHTPILFGSLLADYFKHH